MLDSNEPYFDQLSGKQNSQKSNRSSRGRPHDEQDLDLSGMRETIGLSLFHLSVPVPCVT